MLELLLGETRWFTEDEALFNVRGSPSTMGAGHQSQRGLLLTTFCFFFSRSAGVGDQVYLVSSNGLSTTF